MSLAIDVDRVSHVLLSDGWHVVVDNSFSIDAYEFISKQTSVHGGGQSGVCASGFTFKSHEGNFAGPLTSIIAIRY